MNKKTIAAMGKHDGDHIRISNQWASLDITREHRWTGPNHPEGKEREYAVFFVSGDVKPVKFKLASEALSYALEELAKFEVGAVRR